MPEIEFPLVEILDVIQCALDPYLFAASMVLILWGAVQCFLGRRIVKVIYGFYGCLGGIINGCLFGMPMIFLTGTSAVLVPCVLFWGATGLVAGVCSIPVGVFLFGEALGAVAVAACALGFGLGFDNVAVLIALGIVGLAGGVLALVCRSLVIVLGTAFLGAAHVAIGVLLGTRMPLLRWPVQGGLDMTNAPAMDKGILLGALVILLALTAAGIYVQYSVRDASPADPTSPRPPSRSPSARRTPLAKAAKSP